MDEKQIVAALRARDAWRSHYELEPFEWLEEMAPAGALAPLDAYRVIDPHYRKPRNGGGRNWEPLLIVDDQLHLGADPEMLVAMLDAIDYFERPEAFQNLLLLQLHRFALDFFQGYQVREETFERKADRLTIRGSAGRARREYRFETVVTRDGEIDFSVAEA